MRREPDGRGTRTCVDRGGTFTDVVVLAEDGTASTRKVPSDRAVVGDLTEGALTFGTTVATNALLERRGVPTVLIVTEGFADLVRIGDMTRPALFDPEARWPEPLCTRVIELPGRSACDGRAVSDLILPEVGAPWPEAAVAVCLLHAGANPEHELACARWLEAHQPHLYVALGHRCSPEVGYLARIETTLVDAAITPVLRAALQRDRIPVGARAMRSDGSLCDAHALTAPDAILSGPAAGVLAVRAIANRAGVARAVGLDMGGTSTDVCLVGPGPLPRREGDTHVAGVRVRRAMLEVDTIAAGGGSVLWSDAQRIGVGPASAGADPGPQCLGRGGPPTLTDAALVAGHVAAEAFDPPLDHGRVQLPGEAAAFLDLARDEMAAAIRRLAARRGLDPADHALVPFGGAAGQHAAFVAERLGIDLVLIHPEASVLCAWGQALARVEAAAVRACWVRLPEGWPAVVDVWATLSAELPPLGGLDRSVELRHVGTDHALEVRADTVESALESFRRAHHARYGFHRDLPIEAVHVRVRATGPEPHVRWPDAEPFGLAGRQVDGPVRLDCPTTSVVVPAGWTALSRDGLLVLRRTRPLTRPLPTERTRLAVSLWASRFQSLAAEAGAVLERTARSVNIRERRDFSCAIFDGDGQLVANAPHVPVHLGAMGATVRDLLAHVPEPEEGQHYLCNAPDAGGSHLPDLTVLAAVRIDGVRLFVGCRGHHVDVGGITPGSMPPASTTLAEEGFVVRHLPLLDHGRLRADLATHLSGCREVTTVAADLEAQIASNVCAMRGLRALAPGPVLAAWTRHLQDVAREAVAPVIAALPADAHATDVVDGVPLAVALRREGQRLVVDFAGTGGPHRGNLNAPAAVVRAAVLYVLRVLAAQPIPLNEGLLDAVDLRVPHPSILSPPPDAAVAGGNVETSQRLVDLLLRASGARAASAGTMNNLTIGGDGWSYYETIGGGQGASATGPGASGRQLHMTNTRATDPEVLEHRLPLRLIRFALRTDSGGAGTHEGGEGLVREIEVSEPAMASLLRTGRDRGAVGLGSGGSGAVGADQVRRAGVWQDWNGQTIALSPGDRVRILTPGGGGWGPGGATMSPLEGP